MDEQRQDDQLESIYDNSMPIQDAALGTYWERWTIEVGGEWGSGRSVLAVWHDDDDDDDDDIFTSFDGGKYGNSVEVIALWTYMLF